MKNVTFSDLLDNKRLADYLGLQDMDESQFTAWLEDYRSNLFLDWKKSKENKYRPKSFKQVRNEWVRGLIREKARAKKETEKVEEIGESMKLKGLLSIYQDTVKA